MGGCDFGTLGCLCDDRAGAPACTVDVAAQLQNSFWMAKQDDSVEGILIPLFGFWPITKLPLFH